MNENGNETAETFTLDYCGNHKNEKSQEESIFCACNPHYSQKNQIRFVSMHFEIQWINLLCEQTEKWICYILKANPVVIKQLWGKPLCIVNIVYVLYESWYESQESCSRSMNEKHFSFFGDVYFTFISSLSMIYADNEQFLSAGPCFSVTWRMTAGKVFLFRSLRS